MPHPPVPPILASVIARITAAVPARARTAFLDLLLGAAVSKGGHVTDAILAAGLYSSRGEVKAAKAAKAAGIPFLITHHPQP